MPNADQTPAIAKSENYLQFETLALKVLRGRMRGCEADFEDVAQEIRIALFRALVSADHKDRAALLAATRIRPNLATRRCS